MEDFQAALLPAAADLAIMLCDRHFGIGADGLVLITQPNQHYRMRIFNADGSEAEMCGNAIRCLAKHLLDRGFVTETNMIIETLRASMQIVSSDSGYTVDMGEPIWTPNQIPMLSRDNQLKQKVEAAEGVWEITGVSMGNPHGVVIVPVLEHVPLDRIGPLLETNAIFPAKANIEFVQVLNPKHIRIKVWERGVGPTLACGTGACAALAVTARLGLTERDVLVSLPGGKLRIEWKEDNHLWMTGPASRVYDGEIMIPAR